MTDAATKVIVAWLKEVLVPDETTHMRKGAGSLISALTDAGLAIRPMEPTKAMVEAAGDFAPRDNWRNDVVIVYKAMMRAGE